MKYIKKNITKEWLFKNDFKYNRYFSNKDDAVYTNRFIVARQIGRHSVSLECEVLIYYPEGHISINVYNAGTRDKYPPFYDRQYGISKLLDLIDDKIAKKLKHLGVKIIND